MSFYSIQLLPLIILVGLRLGMLVVGFLLASCRSNPQAM